MSHGVQCAVAAPAAAAAAAAAAAEAIAKLAKEYQEKGVAVVAISSNSIETHPQVNADEGGRELEQDQQKHFQLRCLHAFKRPQMSNAVSFQN